MTDDERAAARAVLISGLSIPRLIDELESGRYGLLVEQHLRRGGDRLAAIAYSHEQLITEAESGAAFAVLTSIEQQADDPSFWSATAGDVLNGISCDFNDELYPEPAEEAGIFNLFQLATTRFALKAADNLSFRKTMLDPSAPQAKSMGAGMITRMLEIAVNDFDAGRLSRKNLLAVFQAAIDNGDILLPSNEFVVMAHVIPLLDAGALSPSQYVAQFENRTNSAAREWLRTRKVKPRPWWRFWK